MFVVIGVVLAGYGLMSDAAIYARTFGMNVNLIWGAVLGGFWNIDDVLAGLQ